jgi:hypothetical protein
MIAFSSEKTKKRANVKIRKANHIVNIFIPTVILMNCYLLIVAAFTYLNTVAFIFWKIFKKPFPNFFNLLLWFVLGIFHLLRLLVQDNMTMAKIMLNFKLEGADLLNFDLEEEARSNLVKIFSKMQRIITQQKYIDEDFVTVAEFLKDMGIVGFTELLGKNLFGNRIAKKNEQIIPQRTVATALFKATFASDVSRNDIKGTEANPFNAKYKQKEQILAPVLALRFSMRDPDTNDHVIDLNFMRYKLMENLTRSKVHRLISFDKNALVKASHYICADIDEKVERQIANFSKWLTKSGERMCDIRKFVKSCKRDNKGKADSDMESASDSSDS